MLETCMGGPWDIRLCVEETKNFGKFKKSRPGGKNGPKF